jgi:hypothetical protein
LLKGLKSIKEKSEQAQQIAFKDRIRNLYLKDGEYAVIRFLTDTDGIIEAKIHEITKTTETGPRYEKHYCTREDLGQCEDCQQGNIPANMMFFWLYVSNVMHKTQNPRLERDENAPRWSQKKVGNTVYYEERIDGPMILRCKRGKDGYLRKKFLNIDEENGTWCDRDYKWSRSGGGINTVYDLLGKDPSKISKEIKAVKESLPELADVVSGKITSFNSEEVEEPPTTSDSEDLF